VREMLTCLDVDFMLTTVVTKVWLNGQPNLFKVTAEMWAEF